MSDWFFPFQGNHVAVGTHKGFVQIWDAAAGKKLFTLEGHTARVGKIITVSDGTQSHDMTLTWYYPKTTQISLLTIS